jgi:hypothetical protein
LQLLGWDKVMNDTQSQLDRAYADLKSGENPYVLATLIRALEAKLLARKMGWNK